MSKEEIELVFDMKEALNDSLLLLSGLYGGFTQQKDFPEKMKRSMEKTVEETAMLIAKANKLIKGVLI